MKLENLGWNSYFEKQFASYSKQGFAAGRISIQHRERYIISAEQGELTGQISGKFRFETDGLQDYPAIGDWVAFKMESNDQLAVIHHVLERKSRFSRKVAGDRTEEQILAANIDIAFLVMGLDGNYNLRRLERSLTVAWESGARPVVVLNKSDLCSNLEECTREVLASAQGADVVVMNAKRTEDINPIRPLLTPGITGVLLGSSGVGKSTITNALLGREHLKVRDIRTSDSHGRHTTTHRELLILPNGGIIIDTPGLRELQLWSGEEGIQDSFDDILELAGQCRFRDCGHDMEPDCGVKQALEDGTLDPGRYESFLKLQREISFQEQRNLIGAQRTEKERWKKISKQSNNKPRNRDK